MARKDPSFDNPSELNELINRYEESQKNQVNIYLDADQLADIADKYAEERRFEEAQQVITYGLRLHPGNTDLLIEQSLLYLDTNQLQKAKEIADSINDNSSEVILLKCELLLNEEKTAEVSTLLEQIKDVNNYDLMADVASLYKDTGYLQEALHWIDEALKHFPDSEELWIMKAECHTQLLETSVAVETYNRLIDMDPFNSNYWIELSRCYFTTQDFSQALNAVDFALAANEQSGEAHIIRGHILFHLERFDDAIDAYKQAIRLEATSLAIGNMFLGLVYNAMEDWKNASDAFKVAIDSLTDEFSMLRNELYISLSLALAHLKKFDEALDLCELALTEETDDAEIYLVEGYIYLLSGDGTSAWKMWHMALYYAPEAETWIRISEYMLETKKLREVRYCLEQAEKIDPQTSDVQPRLALINLLLGDEKGFKHHNALSEFPISIEEMLEIIEGLEKPEYKDFLKLVNKWKKEFPKA